MRAAPTPNHAAVTDGPVDTTVAIDAPEQIRFRFRLAGPAQRAMAHLLDFLILAAGLVLVLLLIVLVASALGAATGQVDTAKGLGAGALMLLAFAAQWLYFALWEGLNKGRTPGKAALSLRVVKAGGEPVGFVDAVLRNLLRAADWLPFGYAAGVLAMVLDGRFRRLGDLAAGTMVIVEDRLRVATAVQVYPPTPEEARALPARVVLDPDELRALEHFFRRAPELGFALSTEMALRVAPALSKKYQFYHPDPVRLLALLYYRAAPPPVAPAAPPEAPRGRPHAQVSA